MTVEYKVTELFCITNEIYKYFYFEIFFRVTVE